MHGELDSRLLVILWVMDNPWIFLPAAIVLGIIVDAIVGLIHGRR